MIELLITMAFEFFKTGLFAIGGGLATIPFLTELGEKYGWFTTETLSTMIAVSESTPGPMGVNMSTYAGYHNAGIIGAIISTLSLVAPSVIVICIIAKYLKKFKELEIVDEIFRGLKPAVVAFIIAACLNLFITTLFDPSKGLSFELINYKTWLLFLALYCFKFKFKDLHPIFIILIAGFCGVIFGL